MSRYFSLISSLPMLKPGDGPKMHLPEFLDAAQHYLDAKSMDELRNLRLSPNETYQFTEGSFAEKFTRWELALRHSILRIRTAKKNAFPLKNADSIKRETIFECDADAVATNAYCAANPLEREKALDLARWTKAEEMVSGHIYDTDVLQAYCIKLQICEKWACLTTSGNANLAVLAAENLDKAVDTVNRGNEK